MKQISGEEFGRMYSCDADYRRIIRDKTVTAWERGDRVMYGEYAGAIRDHYCNGMYRVSLPGGVACVDGASLTPYVEPEPVPPSWLVAELSASDGAGGSELVALPWSDEFRARLDVLTQLVEEHELASASIHVDGAKFLPIGVDDEVDIIAGEIAVHGANLTFACLRSSPDGTVLYEAALGHWPALRARVEMAGKERARYVEPPDGGLSPGEVDRWLDQIEAAEREGAATPGASLTL